MVRIILELPKEANVDEVQGYYKCWFHIKDNTSRLVADLSMDFHKKFFPVRKEVEFALHLNDIMLPQFTSESILRDNDVLKLVFVPLIEGVNIWKEEPKIAKSCKEVTKDNASSQVTEIPKDASSTEVTKVVNGNDKKVAEESSSEDESSSEESSDADDEMEVTAPPVKEPVIITPKVKLTPRQIQVKKAPANPTTSTPNTNPYLVQSEVKISNNFKKKTSTPPAFLKTTPTHKDRYTNRSKVYKTPDKIEAENLSKVLKSEVKDVTQSAKKRKHSDDGDKEAKKRDVLQRSTEKGQIFQTRVNALIKSTPGQSNGSTAVQQDSSSEEESVEMTEQKPAEKIPRDSSSEDEVVIKPAVTANKPISGSSSSESEEGEVQPDPKKKLELASGSSSEESDSEVDVVTTPARPPVIKPATTRENQHFTAAAKATVVPPVAVAAAATKAESSSDESSSDEEEAPKPVPAAAVAVSKPDSSDSSSDEEPPVQPVVQRGGMVGSVIHQSRAIPEVKTDKYYALLSSLQGAPRVADKLAFKMLGMSSDYTPEISAYKEGVVTGFDLSSQSVTIRLCPQFAIISGGGKFELEEDQSVEDSLTLNLRQLIEPKLVPVAANGG